MKKSNVCHLKRKMMNGQKAIYYPHATTSTTPDPHDVLCGLKWKHFSWRCCGQTSKRAAARTSSRSSRIPRSSSTWLQVDPVSFSLSLCHHLLKCTWPNAKDLLSGTKAPVMGFHTIFFPLSPLSSLGVMSVREGRAPATLVCFYV